jgi:hypothetical protein
LVLVNFSNAVSWVQKVNEMPQIVIYVWSSTNGGQNMTVVSPDGFTQVVL